MKAHVLLSLDVQREKIRALEPLKSMFATVSDKCTQKISALKKEENAKIKTLMKEKLYLLKLIDKMKEEKASLQAQVNWVYDQPDISQTIYAV